jgi:hypothetical protein
MQGRVGGAHGASCASGLAEAPKLSNLHVGVLPRQRGRARLIKHRAHLIEFAAQIRKLALVLVGICAKSAFASAKACA